MVRAALLRRHLSDDQRADIAREWRELASVKALSNAGKRGGRGNKKPLDTVSKGFAPSGTRTEAASVFAVSERKVRYAAEVKNPA